NTIRRDPTCRKLRLMMTLSVMDFSAAQFAAIGMVDGADDPATILCSQYTASELAGCDSRASSVQKRNNKNDDQNS
ncbi:MAG: hypothetical protein KAG53_12270, partial [Endozoicomonadaceae bacterium]|nr:hypothetical protein [Endozoicomonadaceae bacterium]